MKTYFDCLLIFFGICSKSGYLYKKESLYLLESVNRLSFYEIYSFLNVPGFSNSAMDGYALKSKRTFFSSIQNIKSFFVVDSVLAGEYVEFDCLDGDFVVEIMTGSRLPSCFDSVIKFEDVEFIGSTIFVNRFIKFGENVRLVGEDIIFGDVVLNKGDIISASHILLLSAIGKTKIDVLRQPNIYLLSTGNELVDLDSGKNVGFSSIFNSTFFYIRNFFTSLGLKVTYLGAVSDSVVCLLDRLNFIFDESDCSIILTTGAVSKGRSDFIPILLDFIGVEIFFHGVNIKPGKPILFGYRSKNVYIFCLPGNPISSIVGVRFFVYPFLRMLFGLFFEEPVKGRLVNTYFSSRSCDLFLKAYTFLKGSFFYVKILSGQESFKLTSMLESNSFVFLKSEDAANEGDFVDVFFYDVNNFG